MSYIINKTDGSVLTNILDGTTNTDTGLTLIGRNFPTYGEIQNENFVRLLENFADPTPPGVSVGFTPLPGTLWYNTNTISSAGLLGPRLYVYNGANWIPVSESTVSATAPTIYKTGDQWWDTTNQQLKVYTGSGWSVIGPGNSSSQGKSGAFVETVTDSSSVNHQVVAIYSSNNLASIFSLDADFDLAPSNTLYAQGFQSVKRGITVANTSIFNGTASNALTVGNISPTVLARIDRPNTFANNITVNGNISFGSNANVAVSGNDVLIQNKVYNGNIVVSVNGPTGINNALLINGATGTITASAVPTSGSHLTNKTYVDFKFGVVQTQIDNVNDQLLVDIQQVFNDYISNINNVVDSTNSNLNLATGNITSNVADLAQYTTSNIGRLDGLITQLRGNITAANSQIVLRATLNSPVFTGILNVPPTTNYLSYASSLGQSNNPYQLTLTRGITVATGDTIRQFRESDSALIATFTAQQSYTNSAYVTVTLQSGEPTQGSVANRISVNGVLVSPTTGITTAVYLGPNLTYPGIGDNTSKAASTAYVDATANLLWRDANLRINTSNTAVVSYVTGLLTPKANITSPEFQGIPTAPTASAGTQTTQIATTAFVKTAVNAVRLNYTISSAPPSGGQDGDLWFQIG
jgi:hypothetical protein